MTDQPALTVSNSGCRPQIRRHVEEHLGAVTAVYREGSIDILCVGAVAERPMHTLVTAGMSDQSMDTRDRKDAPQYIEVMMSLPRQWNIASLTPNDADYWPIRLLAGLAEMPTKTGRALGWGDTVANGEPPAPYAEGSAQYGVILAPSLLVPKEFYSLDEAEKHIEFYAAIPLYKEELDARADKGMEFLLSALLDNQINDLVDLKRRNAMKKKRFGFF